MKEIIWALIILIGGLVLAITSFNDSRDAAKLEKYGIEVVSEALSQYTENTKNGAVTGYSIAPSYKVQGGGMYTCHGNVSKDVIDRLQVNPTIKIRYLLTDPTICTIEGKEKSQYWLVILIGAVMFLGSAAYLYNRSSISH